jgi:hypothetical protein
LLNRQKSVQSIDNDDQSIGAASLVSENASAQEKDISMFQGTETRRFRATPARKRAQVLGTLEPKLSAPPKSVKKKLRMLSSGEESLNSTPAASDEENDLKDKRAKASRQLRKQLGVFGSKISNGGSGKSTPAGSEDEKSRQSLPRKAKLK